MRRYFFNIVRGRAFIPDPEGDDLPGDEEAKEHAEIVAREMIEERHKFNTRSIERWAFIVTDDAGRHVATVPFTTQSARAKSDARPSKEAHSNSVARKRPRRI